MIIYIIIFELVRMGDKVNAIIHTMCENVDIY